MQKSNEMIKFSKTDELEITYYQNKYWEWVEYLFLKILENHKLTLDDNIPCKNVFDSKTGKHYLILDNTLCYEFVVKMLEDKFWMESIPNQEYLDEYNK